MKDFTSRFAAWSEAGGTDLDAFFREEDRRRDENQAEARRLLAAAPGGRVYWGSVEAGGPELVSAFERLCTSPTREARRLFLEKTGELVSDDEVARILRESRAGTEDEDPAWRERLQEIEVVYERIWGDEEEARLCGEFWVWLYDFRKTHDREPTIDEKIAQPSLQTLRARRQEQG